MYSFFLCLCAFATTPLQMTFVQIDQLNQTLAFQMWLTWTLLFAVWRSKNTSSKRTHKLSTFLMDHKKAGFLKFYCVQNNENREEQKKNATRNWFILRKDGILLHSSDKSKVHSMTHKKVCLFIDWTECLIWFLVVSDMNLFIQSEISGRYINVPYFDGLSNNDDEFGFQLTTTNQRVLFFFFSDRHLFFQTTWFCFILWTFSFVRID